MKNFLNDRMGNLLTVAKAAHDHITLQVRGIKQKLSASYDRLNTDLCHPTLLSLRYIATPEGLRTLKPQLSRLNTPLPACTGVFEAQMGLPCSHTIRTKIALKQELSEDDIGGYWKYFRYGERPPTQPTMPASLMAILEPRHIINTRGRPRNGQEDPWVAADTSTRRYPSWYELQRGYQVNAALNNASAASLAPRSTADSVAESFTAIRNNNADADDDAEEDGSMLIGSLATPESSLTPRQSPQPSPQLLIRRTRGKRRSNYARLDDPYASWMDTELLD